MVELVSVKMLPFDNKSELQVVIDTPEGTTLESTSRVASERSIQGPTEEKADPAEKLSKRLQREFSGSGSLPQTPY